MEASAIAGIVTDGHNEQDQFDRMREEQLHRQRNVRGSEEYGDEESGVYDEEDDQEHLDGQDEDQDRPDDEDEDQDEDELQMQIHPDLIAAAHKMGVELDSEQIQELQKFIEQQQIDLDGGEESEQEQQSQDSRRQSASKQPSRQQESSEDEQAYEYLQQEQ